MPFDAAATPLGAARRRSPPLYTWEVFKRRYARTGDAPSRAARFLVRHACSAGPLAQASCSLSQYVYSRGTKPSEKPRATTLSGVTPGLAMRKMPPATIRALIHEQLRSVLALGALLGGLFRLNRSGVSAFARTGTKLVGVLTVQTTPRAVALLTAVHLAASHLTSRGLPPRH